MHRFVPACAEQAWQASVAALPLRVFSEQRIRYPGLQRSRSARPVGGPRLRANVITREEVAASIRGGRAFERSGVGLGDLSRRAEDRGA
jgi:hypothetical protein